MTLKYEIKKCKESDGDMVIGYARLTLAGVEDELQQIKAGTRNHLAPFKWGACQRECGGYVITVTEEKPEGTPDPAKKDHLVWSPDSEKPPRNLMTAKQAHVVAGKMAGEHRGQRFYVAQLVEYAEAPPVPEATWGKL